MRVATAALRGGTTPKRSFNSRDPCGSRHPAATFFSDQLGFQLTRPVRVATSQILVDEVFDAVSTHATRAGRDHRCFSVVVAHGRFNSRDPCGSRQSLLEKGWFLIVFQLTRPVRVATGNGLQQPRSGPRFNSRDPCGSRREGMNKSQSHELFQLTRPVRVATHLCGIW